MSDSVGATEPQWLRAAGYLLFRGSAGGLEFLLLRTADRWDVPKGLVEPGESLLAAAGRELLEETGIGTDQLWTDPGFAFRLCYRLPDDYAWSPGRHKELTIFLGVLRGDASVQLSGEHERSRWWPWRPPHCIQRETIDPLLAAAADFVAQRSPWPPSRLGRSERRLGDAAGDQSAG
jgi:bis(5'-nucleosidyl)-tetraphosphatase